MEIKLAGETELNSIVELIRSSKLGKVYFREKNLNEIVRKAIVEKSIYFMEETQVIGFVWSDENGCFDKYPYLHMIIVDSNHRSKGYGKLLIDFFENTLNKDYEKFFLMVGDFNPRAKKLYESIGYKEIGILPEFYRKDVNEHLMMKSRFE